jgi:DNA repair protein RadC
MHEELRKFLLDQQTDRLDLAALIALLLRVEMEQAVALLRHYDDLAGLMQAQYPDLMHYLSPTQAAQISAALELGRRMAADRPQERPFVQGAADAARLLLPEMEALPQEHFRVMLLDVHRRVISVPTVYMGSLNMTVVRAAEVFRTAIIRNAASVILAHNHPSGDPTPSQNDLTITEDLILAGRALDIAVLDHLIIGQGRWVSLRDVGLKF